MWLLWIKWYDRVRSVQEAKIWTHLCGMVYVHFQYCYFMAGVGNVTVLQEINIISCFFLIVKLMFNFVIIIINSQQLSWFSKGIKHFLFMLMLKRSNYTVCVKYYYYYFKKLFIYVHTLITYLLCLPYILFSPNLSFFLIY